MKIIDIIKNRHSPRAFSDKIVSENDLIKIFECAQWAASAYNEQPWRFIYANKADNAKYNKLLDCLVESNQVWAKSADVLIITLAKKNLTRNNKPNRHYMYDLGQSVANMAIAAESLGMHMHQMGGYFKDKVIEHFDIPDEYESVSMIALGYKGDASILPEDLRANENKARVRKALDEIILKKD